MQIEFDKLDKLIEFALNEDIGTGDATTLYTIDSALQLKAGLIAKAAGVLAGTEVFKHTFLHLDDKVEISYNKKDGDKVAAGEVVAEISGPGRAILSGERTALNFLQRMSGIATATNRLVEAVKGTKAIILDTRKTAPGLRLLDKWAVQIGGGQNHRFGLFDMVMIKDNHISAAGSITRAVQLVRKRDKENLAIEVEVKNRDELREAVELNVERIMLDNMSPVEMKEAVVFVNGRVELEASGNVTLDNVLAIAESGVDYISVGSLTHSVQALDLSLLIYGSAKRYMKR